MNPLPAAQALDAYFLEARCRLLDLAAILDRLGRGAGSPTAEQDPRYLKIQKALELLQKSEPHRAEEIQKLFSLDYDPSWPRPEPR
jgi:hypothetical protein